MKLLRYLGETVPGCFVHGKVYKYLGQEGRFHRIIDESGEDYLYRSLAVFESAEQQPVKKGKGKANRLATTKII